MTDSTRVVLVKPGDVLIFGNLGDLGEESEVPVRELAADLKRVTSVASVVFFTGDIDLAAVPR